jgi:uncharacterized protein YutD
MVAYCWYGCRVSVLKRGTRAECFHAIANMPTDTQEQQERKRGANVLSNKDANRFKYQDGTYPLRKG